MIYQIAILLAAIVVVISGNAKNNDELIQKFDKTMPELVDKFNNILADLTPLEEVRHDISKLKNISALKSAHRSISALSEEAGYKINRALETKRIKFQEMETAIKHIYLYSKFAKTSIWFVRYLNLIQVQNLIKNKPFMCKYEDKEECSLNYYDVETILASSKDLNEIKYYWLEWKDGTKNLLGTLNKYCELYVSNAHGFGVPLRILYFSEFADDDFMKHMDKVMDELKIFYEQFHAYLRLILKKEYGHSAVTNDGKIRHDVFEAFYHKIVRSNAKNLRDHPKTNYFQEQNYTPKKFAEEASLFFKSMGFEELSNDFWSKRFTESNAKVCESNAYVSTPNINLKYCPNVTYANYITMHSDMALLHYANQKKNLAFSFYQSYGLDRALSDAVVFSVKSSNYKQATTADPTDHYINEPVNENLFLKYFIVMMTLPQHYINSKLLLDRIYAEFGMDRINEKYWKLMDQHMGVVPPVYRNKKCLDLPLSFYDVNNNIPASQFFKNVVGYQIYEGLCEKAEKYSYDATNPAQLHTCDFHESTKAGTLLKEMMQLGSTKSWQKVLSTVTGNENGMSVQPLIHYYSNVVDKIRESNEKEHTVVGW